MDIRTLESFLSLANYLNFTKSAEQMYISQPAFSRQIARLEEEFGCELFLRNKRKVELTEYGRAFMESAERISSEYNKWIIVLKQMQSRKTGHLKIGFLQDLPNEFLPKIVNHFTLHYNNIQLSLNDCGMSDIINGLLKNDLDFGFTLSNNIDLEFDNIETLVVSSSTLCIALPETHALANKHSILLQELSNESFIMINPDTYAPASRHILGLCKMAGFEPNIVAYSTFVPSMLMLVKCGVGIAVVANNAQPMAADGIKFVPISNPNAKMRTILMWKNTNKNPIVPIFLEAARVLLEENKL